MLQCAWRRRLALILLLVCGLAVGAAADEAQEPGQPVISVSSELGMVVLGVPQGGDSLLTGGPTEEPEPEEPEPFTVRFVYFVDGIETVFVAQEVLPSAALAMPDVTPALAGMTFAHWYDARVGAETPFAFEQSEVTENLSLVAHFIADEHQEAPSDEVEIIIVPDMPVPLAGPKLEIDFSIRVGENFQLGDVITFVSALDGLAGAPYALQWQVQAGGGWADIEGATGETYALVTDAENITYAYRLTATILAAK